MNQVYFTGVKKDLSAQFIDGLGTESGIDPLDSLWRNFHAHKETVLGISEDSEEIGVAWKSG